MIDAFFWGIIGSISLTLGGLIGILFKMGNRTLGLVMAFGAGVLIAAVTYELTFDAFNKSAFGGAPLVGFVAGAATFFGLDLLIEKLGARGRKAIEGNHASTLVVPIILATILDGVPESLVIGMGLLGGHGVGIGMLAAVFISNLPEAIAGTSGMVAGGWSWKKIIVVWLFVSFVCALASMAGFALFANASHTSISFIQTFAAGSILVMLSNTMIPEAYEHGGKLAGIFTVLGFLAAVCLVIFERTSGHPL
jgi:ZIP family zinc transporter